MGRDFRRGIQPDPLLNAVKWKRAWIADTQANIAQAIRDRGADYVLAVKDNQPKLAELIKDFWRCFRVHPATDTPHLYVESVET